MNFCNQCGAGIVIEVPPADNRPRYVCTGCRTVHYENPRVIVGCIPEWQGSVLLCRRSIEPRAGYWTLPAGFMELGETTVQAAARETLEEANARVEIGALYTLLNLPHISQVYMIYRSTLLDLGFSPGAESLEVKLFETGGIPWEELAFPTVRHTLECWVDDLRRNQFRLRAGTLVKGEAQFTCVPDPGHG